VLWGFPLTAIRHLFYLYLYIQLKQQHNSP